MAKYRHRIFEMYECRDEAPRALTPKSARPVTEATAPESWTFKHLAVSHSPSWAYVQLKRAQTFGIESTTDLRLTFLQIGWFGTKGLVGLRWCKVVCAAPLTSLS